MPIVLLNLDELDEILLASEKIDFNKINVVNDIVNSYNKCKKESYKIYRFEKEQNNKFKKDSLIFLGSIIENINN